MTKSGTGERQKTEKKKAGSKGTAQAHGPRKKLENHLHRIEFFRHALALFPDPGGSGGGTVFFVQGHNQAQNLRFCTCSESAAKTCRHLREASALLKEVGIGNLLAALGKNFQESLWYRLAALIGEDGNLTPISSVTIKQGSSGDRKFLKAFDEEGKELFTYLSWGPDTGRLIDRFTGTLEDSWTAGRGAVLGRLALLTLTENERLMNERGYKTRGQEFLESFLYRLAYHCFREFGSEGISVKPAVEKATGSFTLTFAGDEESPLLRLIVPRNRVRSLLGRFSTILPNQHGMPIHPVPLKSIFKISRNTEMDLEVRPLIRVIQENGEEAFFEQKDLDKYRYGDLVYIESLGILAELEPPGRERKFVAPRKMVLKKSQVPEFLDELGDEILQGNTVTSAVQGLRLYRQVEGVEISPEALDRDWCWLSVRYGFGASWISLAELVKAGLSGERYLEVEEGWVDLRSPGLGPLNFFVEKARQDRPWDEKGRIRVSRFELFRIAAAGEKPPVVRGDDQRARLVKRILSLKPSDPMPSLEGLTSHLRPYQQTGVEWIRFLQENGFGGLLCDEMGLGKTHQAMAFMLFLRQHREVSAPFLVVCPTTVLSHWLRKIKEHAPPLRVAVYHGLQRDMEALLRENDVILTTYGLLWRDVDTLGAIPFGLVVFDEIQHLKNPQTRAYRAAREIRAEMKLGLTGTPVENTLHDLKALMDLVIPGYLGPDSAFEKKYVHPIEEQRKRGPQEELTRLIAPFYLRRLKQTVLHDLPPKIEDVRTCILSEEQVKLYRDAIAHRGKPLMDVLKREEQKVPYIHIFSLLSLLKRICNHPALVARSPHAYKKFESGKWDLFTELLSECIDGGQKVVVYSQYLGMIEIITQYLREQDIGFVALTGASRNRGKIVETFQEDPECRVYVGSLKAGGVGVDLVAASVVIHYDRWWNAAREDQATDRVHRIGQKRAVQVFKLITEGTLEEKISAIIGKKRDLMERVVREDDASALKIFTREELMELLSPLERP